MPLDHYRYAVVGCMSRQGVDLARLPHMMPTDRAKSLVLRARFADEAQGGGRASGGGSHAGGGGGGSGSGVRSLFSREDLSKYARWAAASFGKSISGASPPQAARSGPQRPVFGVGGGGLGGSLAGLRIRGR